MSKLLQVKTAPATPEGEPILLTINIDLIVTIEPDPADASVTLVTMSPERVLRVLEPYAAISGVISKRAN